MAVLLIILFCVLNVFHNVLATPSKDGDLYDSKHCIKMTPEREAEIDIIIERISDLLNDITSDFEHYDIRLIKLEIESHSEDEIEEKELQLQLIVNDCAIEKNHNNNEHIIEEVDIKIETPVERKEHNDVIKNDVKETTTCNMYDEFVEELMEMVNELLTSNLAAIDSDENVTKRSDSENNDAVSKTTETSASHNFSARNEIASSNTKAESIPKSSTSVDNVNISENDAKSVADYNDIYTENHAKSKIDNKDITIQITGTKNSGPELMILNLTNLGLEVIDLLGKDKNNPLLVYVQEIQGRNAYVFL